MVAAIAIGGVVSAGTSIAAGSSAAKTAKKNAASNNALQTSIYNANSAALAPFRRDGQGATDMLSRLLGIGDSATGTASNPYTAQQQQAGALQVFQDSAPYQAEFQAGQKAVTAALGSKGLLDSGAALKDLQSYGDQFLSGKLNTYEAQLAALGGQGLTAASAQAGVGQGYANAVSANNNTAANAQENAALNTGNSINSLLTSLTTGAALGAGLSSSYGQAALGGYSSSAANAPQYGFGPWKGF